MPKAKHTSPTLKLAITDEQWERAKRASSGGCLIADAIKTQYPEYSSVSVDMATVRFSDRKRGVRYTYLTPEAARLSLLYFDQGWPNYTDQVTIKGAVQIVPITVSRQALAKQAERREERRAFYEDKLANGEELTAPERRGYEQITNPKPSVERPISRGPAEVTSTRNGPVITGGDPIPQPDEKKHGKHPNLLTGRNRHYGAKVSKPGIVFEDAVESAVAQRLAELGQSTNEPADQ